MPHGSRTNPLVINLDLEHVEDLFVTPSASPMSPNYRVHSYTSGVEYASSVIAARRHRGDVCLEIRVAEISTGDDVGQLVDQVRGGRTSVGGEPAQPGGTVYCRPASVRV
jgi:hypothetical protein